MVLCYFIANKFVVPSAGDCKSKVQINQKWSSLNVGLANKDGLPFPEALKIEHPRFYSFFP